MGAINKIPLGLLNMLGSQTGGKNPFDLAEIVRPTVDLTSFYHAQALKTSAVSLVYTAVGDNVQMEVPAGEAWFVYTIGVSVTSVTGADRAAFGVYLRDLPKSGVAATLIFNTRELNDVVAGDILSDSVRFPVPLPLTAGMELSLLTHSLTNSRTVFMTALYATFQA